jgi:hypothetical protein
MSVHPLRWSQPGPGDEDDQHAEVYRRDQEDADQHGEQAQGPARSPPPPIAPQRQRDGIVVQAAATVALLQQLYRPPVDRCRATYLNPPYALIPLVVDEETGKEVYDDGCPVLDGATLPEVAEYLAVHGDRIGRARHTVNQAALAVRKEF